MTPDEGYRIAEERIEEVLRGRTTRLNLSGLGLTDIPNKIAQIESLKELDFSDNKITRIPQSIATLHTLRTLDLSRNRVVEINDNISSLSNLGWLNLTDNKIEKISDAISELKDLQLISLWNNCLKNIPEEIFQLFNLEKLVLIKNNISRIPEEISSLKKLTWLTLWDNQLTTIPEEISQLSSLRELDLSSNKIENFPEAILQVVSLRKLSLGGNKIDKIPNQICQLSSLRELDFFDNKLTAIPKEIYRLSSLKEINLNRNPLDPISKSAYSGGIDEFFAYLRSLQNPKELENLYEARLVLIGEGNVGKTTLLKALTGRDPKADEQTTHGISIDIEAFRLPHPNQVDTQLKFNAWDFGGQEVYRVTHQFFFSKRSAYLLLWEPRRGVQQCQVEDWLNMLRLRVGEDARVIIVSTHCKTGERIARIDKPVLKRDYGDIIVDFLEVDSLVDDPETGEKVGIAALKQLIADTAKTFDQMGAKLNRAWRESRDELLAMDTPRITYTEFAAVCKRHGLSEIAIRTLADLMHDLGYIVYYGDDESLKDDVVLQPEWLTKAIGFVLEDRTTQDMDGILPDSRLKDVWFNHPFTNEPQYSSGFLPVSITTHGEIRCLLSVRRRHRQLSLAACPPGAA
jgi:internalin A